MHWPYANIILVIATSSLMLTYTMYFLKIETKTTLAIFGAMFSEINTYLLN